MRTVLLVLALALCAAGGLIGFWSLGRAESQELRRSYTATAARPEAELATTADVHRLENQVTSMREEMTRLAAELDSLRASSGRETVDPRATTETAALTISAEQRAAVLQILEEDRDAREEERAQQRRQREQRVLTARAERIADELGLAPADETKLAGILVLESEKRSQLFERVRAEGWDRDLVSQGMKDLRAWRDAAYEAAFGVDIAGQIRELGGTQGFERSGGRSSDDGQDSEQRRGGNRRD